MWTEQAVETLRKLALEGRSAAWIAAALGAPSRNAVIGKASRIGIKLNGGPYSGLRSERPPPAEIPWLRTRSAPIGERSRPERRPPATMPWGRTVSLARSRATAVPGEKRRADVRIFATAEVGEMRRIGFAEISDLECRWPLGDPTEEDFAYCSLQVAKGHAYCAGHCRLAYRSPGVRAERELAK